jgi:hypothetical protein
MTLAESGSRAQSSTSLSRRSSGKYQSYTQADMGKLRQAGYGNPFLTVEEASAVTRRSASSRRRYEMDAGSSWPGCAATEPPKEVKPVTAGPPAVPMLPPGPVTLRNHDSREEVAVGRALPRAGIVRSTESEGVAFPRRGRRAPQLLRGPRRRETRAWALATGLYNPGLKGTRALSVALSLTGVTGEGAGPDPGAASRDSA